MQIDTFLKEIFLAILATRQMQIKLCKDFISFQHKWLSSRRQMAINDVEVAKKGNPYLLLIEY